MQKIIVLGGGMVGSAMAIDLSKKYSVTVADKNEQILEKIGQKTKEVHGVLLDVSDHKALNNTILDFDLVICAVPGFLGFSTLKSVIQSGKNVVDISFFPENALDLDALAKEHGVTAVVDCGVAPGMGNIILGYHNERMYVSHFECIVGGLPKVKKWPFCYKAPFSPVDVIEEYTRPARYVENGKMVIKEPLSDCEYVEFDRVGTLESFNSDGLRTLITTMPHIPNMKEKTLRYPGHAEYIKVLKESGFFSLTKIKLNETEIAPIEFTSRILFDEWKLGDHEEELTVMQLKMQGEKEEVVYQLYDEYDHDTQTSSMARTTGYTATAVANLILDGKITARGVLPPEYIGKDEKSFQFIMNYLEERGVMYKKNSV